MSQLFDMLKEFDIAKFLPEMDAATRQLGGWFRFALLIGPLVLAGLGAWLYYAPPDEANYSVGYRSQWSMSGLPVWRYSQKYAGKLYLTYGGIAAGVALILSLFFGPLGLMGTAVISLLCILVEIVLMILLNRHIEMHIRKKFDQNGDPRK